MFKKMIALSMVIPVLSFCGDSDSSETSGLASTTRSDYNCLYSIQQTVGSTTIDGSMCADYNVVHSTVSQFQTVCTDNTETKGVWSQGTCTVASGAQGCKLTGSFGEQTTWYTGSMYNESYWSTEGGTATKATCTGDTSEWVTKS